MAVPPVLLAVLVGRPRTIDEGSPWVSAYRKSPVVGPVALGLINLAGDAQADLRVHGGPDKAVCVYAAWHLRAWREETGLEVGAGAFGENFHVEGQVEAGVCIGDTYRVGSAVVQVAQPRGPCWKIERHWQRPGLTEQVRATGRTGWYLRVLEPGEVAAGDPLVLTDRPHPEWTIARANEVTTAAPADRHVRARAALAACPLLAANWRTRLESAS